HRPGTEERGAGRHDGPLRRLARAGQRLSRRRRARPRPVSVLQMGTTGVLEGLDELFQARRGVAQYGRLERSRANWRAASVRPPHVAGVAAVRRGPAQGCLSPGPGPERRPGWEPRRLRGSENLLAAYAVGEIGVCREPRTGAPPFLTGP